ncbi:MAG: glycoside hydrolase family 127 protein [Clostridia bacterium]|nr:glycoside hydrolase family 127 protein [Clostridia bacterium]
MKAFYNRAPLAANTRANLDLGKIKPQGWLKDMLLALREGMARSFDQAVSNAHADGGSAVQAADALNMLIGLAWTLDDDGLKDKARSEIAALMASQDEDGRFTVYGSSDTLARIRAVNAVYAHFTATGEKKALIFLNDFFKYEYKFLAREPLRGKACAQASDNLYTALKLYNVTGQRYLLELCKLLKAQMLDWTNIFSTFPNIQPMSKSMSVNRLQEGMDGEKNGLEGENHPFFASYYHQTLGENVGDALKAPGMVSLFKSGFKEQNGFRYGWEKLLKYHGTALGMFTCDEHLNGNDPSAGIDVKALSRAMRSIELLLDCGSFADDLGDILEKLAFNALPATVDWRCGLTQPLQQTNQISVTKGEHGWYNADQDANLCTDALADGGRFDSAWALSCFTASLWQASADDGLSAVSYAPCTVSHVIESTLVRLDVDTEYPFTESVKIRVSAAKPVEFPMYLRIPSWAQNPMIHLPDGEIMSVRAGEVACLRQRWTSDSEIRLVLPRSCRLSRWSRQSAAVELGPLLMALPIEVRKTMGETEEGARCCQLKPNASWAYALADSESIKLKGTNETHFGFTPGRAVPKVMAKLIKTNLWQKEGADAGAIPILPECKNEDAQIFELVPYGAAKLRISQFPTAKMEENDA